MRAIALVLAMLAFATTHEPQEQEPDDHSRCQTQCAAIPRDTHGTKACKCDAGKGTSCDANGNRTQEEMAGCLNRQHCKKHCCHCCPKD